MLITDKQLTPDNIKAVNTTYSGNDFENIVLHISLNIKYTIYVTNTEWEEILIVTSYEFFVLDI
jgi:hypothetical protein